MRLCVCAGMRRSGSTLQAQIVCAILGQPGAQLGSPAQIQQLLSAAAELGSVCVVKCHEYVPGISDALSGGEAKAVYVFRDIRDVAASIARKYRTPVLSLIHGGVDPILQEYRDWVSTPGVHVARYEDMTADLPAEVMRLATYLGVPMEHLEAVRIAADLSLVKQEARIRDAFKNDTPTMGTSANEFDPATLLHRNHITSHGEGFESVLKPIEVAALEWRVRHWLHEAGYRPRHSKVTQLLALGWFKLRATMNQLRRKLVTRNIDGSARK